MNFLLFFSDKKVVFYPAFVCLFVCLSVCLLASSRRNYQSDLHNNVVRDVSLEKDVLIKFRQSSTSGLGSSTLRDRALFTTAPNTPPPCRPGLHRSEAIYRLWRQ